MDITLYYTPQTRAIRPRWLMEELGLEYKLQNIDLYAGEGETEEYKKINPLGAVPAMKIDGEVMLESGAMCHWMADYYADSKLAPAIQDAKSAGISGSSAVADINAYKNLTRGRQG